jgi:CubicO group peptidase (beta-lactamase class C family)
MRAATVEGDAVLEAAGAGATVPWWSFTKAIVAAAALVLVRAGRLALDEPLRGRPFTLRHLLQHRSGLPDYGGLPAYHEAVARGEPPWPAAELLRRISADRLLFAPGRGWAYSNPGYLLVGQAIEAASRLPLGQALRSLVLDPLGIQGAHSALTPDDLAGAELGAIAQYHPGWVYHGLLVGPLDQAALALHRLMAGTLLPSALVALMVKPHRLGGPVPDRPWAEPGYGLGLMCGLDRTGSRVAGHTGGGPGSVCAMYHRVRSDPPRTAATFCAGDDVGTVERAAFGRLRPVRQNNE